MKYGAENVEDRKAGKPYFTEIVKIIKAEEVSGTPRGPWDNAEIDQFAVELTFESKFDWNPTMRLSGDLVMEGGKVIDFGNIGWRVTQLFDEFDLFPDGKNFKELADDIPFIDPKLLKKLVGREIARLRYVAKISDKTGKPLYYNLYTVAAVGGRYNLTYQAAKDKVEASFLRGLERGFPSNYDPTVIDKASKPVSGKSTEVYSGGSDEPADTAPVTAEAEFGDDDLPF